jgi:tetratricopeptide (TPR) repeat protein
MLYEGLGSFQRRITTSSAEAQQYFDQGMRLMWAFNHDEATRSFAKAAQIDPTCAACYWGVSLTVGPNYNLPFLTEERARVAWESLARARESAARSSPVEQALMNINAWKLWTPDGKPAAGVATLESVLTRDPEHPGANHYYVHAIEASPHPDRALAAAERLRDLMPAAGHLVHMPAHIMQRIGRYSLSSLRHAVTAEDRLSYDEPKNWFFPARHLLGAQLLLAGQAGDAERTYREDLRQSPANGWSLYGLSAALKAQGKSAQAAEAVRQFEVAWKHADVTLTASAY